MSTSTDSCHDIDMTEAKCRQNICSPASSYSTYSREIKYIFNSQDESQDEDKDYCHINSHTKQNFLSHTPRTLSATSQLSSKDNNTQYTRRDEHGFAFFQHVPPQYVTPSRTNSVLSNTTRVRGPVNSHMEEALYFTTRGYGPSKPNTITDVNSGDRAYFSPSSEVLSHSCTRTSYPSLNNYMFSHPQSTQKPSIINNNMHNKHNRNNGVGTGLHTLQNHHYHPATNIHSTHHYQQPYIHPVVSQPPHPQELHHSQEPPYPMPPRYNYQHHSRRKTWSPPVLMMNPSNINNTEGSKISCSNDSLDVVDDSSVEKITVSLSEDLDMTPPKLAPISGVLAQKPGQNVIRPVAFKPIHASSALNPGGHVPRQFPGTDDHVNGSCDPTRSHSVKPGSVVMGKQGSPEFHSSRSNVGAFSSMAKFQHQISGGGCGNSTEIPTNSHQSIDNINHSYPLISYCPAADVDISRTGSGSHHSDSQHSHNSSQHTHSGSQHTHSGSQHTHSGSQHSISISSHHNVSNNSYNNIPVNSHTNVNSSHLCASDETSISSEFHSSDRPDSFPSLNISRVSSHAVEGILQTPSPSDSGVGELEAILREKDAEINTLREVMERNEHAIFQVYEERRNVWLNETQELQNEYERRLKIQSRKSYKTEQVLSLQVYKLQQEQKTLQEDNAKIISERDLLRQQVDDNHYLITQLKQKFEAVMNGEIMSEKPKDNDKNKTVNLSPQDELSSNQKDMTILKSQLHSFQADIEKKDKELAEKCNELSAKADEVKILKNDLLRLKDPPVLVEVASQTSISNELTATENITYSMLEESSQTISDLQEQLTEIQEQVALIKEEHEKEREQWLDEKNKVIRYQKQLQLNYVQMQRKNSALETEVQQLTLELEHRDMKLIALSGEESVC